MFAESGISKEYPILIYVFESSDTDFHKLDQTYWGLKNTNTTSIVWKTTWITLKSIRQLVIWHMVLLDGMMANQKVCKNEQNNQR